MVREVTAAVKRAHPPTVSKRNSSPTRIEPSCPRLHHRNRQRFPGVGSVSPCRTFWRFSPTRFMRAVKAYAIILRALSGSGSSTLRLTGPLLKSGFLLGMGLGAAKLTTLLAHMLMTNLGGPVLYGTFALALIPIGILTAVGLGGLHQSLIRFGVPLVQRGRPTTEFVRMFRRVTLLSVGASTVLAAGVTALAPMIASEVFAKPEITVPMQIMAVSLPFLVALTMVSYAFRAFEEFWPDTAFRNLLRGVLLLTGVALFGLILPPLNVTRVAWVFTGSAVLAAGLALAFFRIKIRSISHETALQQPAPRSMLRFGIIMTLGVITHEIMMVTDRTLLGVFVSTEEVGLYSGAALFARQTEFGALVVHGVLAPRLAGRTPPDRVDEATATVGKAIALMAAVYVIGVGICATLAPSLLGLLGDGFDEMSSEFTILVAGFSLFSVTTPLSSYIQFRGRPEHDVLVELLGAAVSAALGLLLINTLGTLGAAIATATALASISVARIFVFATTVRRRQESRPITPGD